MPWKKWKPKTVREIEKDGDSGFCPTLNVLKAAPHSVMGGWISGIIQRVFSFLSFSSAPSSFTFALISSLLLSCHHQTLTGSTRESALQLVCVCVCFSHATPMGHHKRLRIIPSSPARSRLCEGPAFYSCCCVSFLLLFMHLPKLLLLFFYIQCLRAVTLNSPPFTLSGKPGRQYRGYGVYSFPLPLTSLLTQQAGR